jgi:membrane dipeptidase
MKRAIQAGILAVTAAMVTMATGCSALKPQEHVDVLTARARILAAQSIIVDTHVDVPYRLEEEWADISRATEGGDFDYPRARKGGLNAPFMSIYTPARLQEDGGSKELADRLIDMVEGFETSWPEKFSVARSVADVREHFAAGLISLPMGMENGAPIGTDLANLRHFFDRGIRYVTLVHSRWNAISDSSYDDDRHWGGLSPFGRQVVEEMNRLGMMIDISHLTDAAALQALELSTAPVIASHSSCRAFTPGWERNMSDEVLMALADNGGVIHINFGSAFLTEPAQQAAQERRDAVDAFRDEHDYAEDDEAVKAFRDAYREEHPPVLAELSDVVDHIDHVVSLVGIDHVGIGSDYDGVGPSTPVGLEDVSYYPDLIRELVVRGYSDDEVKKIMGENTLRVWKEVEQMASLDAAEGGETTS